MFCTTPLWCIIAHTTQWPLMLSIIFPTHFNTFPTYFCISYIRMHCTYFALHHAYITSPRNSADIITCHFYCLPTIILLCHTHGSVPGHPLISWSHQITYRLCSSPPMTYFYHLLCFISIFCHSSLSPHCYYCSIFHVPSILIVFFVLPLLV